MRRTMWLWCSAAILTCVLVAGCSGGPEKKIIGTWESDAPPNPDPFLDTGYSLCVITERTITFEYVVTETPRPPGGLSSLIARPRGGGKIHAYEIYEKGKDYVILHVLTEGKRKQFTRIDIESHNKILINGKSYLRLDDEDNGKDS